MISKRKEAAKLNELQKIRMRQEEIQKKIAEEDEKKRRKRLIQHSP